jgi:nucleoid-associated protein YgaU
MVIYPLLIKEKAMSKATKMFVVLIVAIAALIAMGKSINKPTYCYVGSVVASEGDTLWSIAKANCYGNSTTNMVNDIMELNPELKTRYLRIGESIKLPTENAGK